MVSIYVILAVVLAVVHGKSLTIEDTVQVQVYYESLCPASIHFITTQLYSTFVGLGKERINLELVPWGRASKLSMEQELSLANMGQMNATATRWKEACAIDLGTVEQSTEFVFCAERSDAPADDANLQKCADIVGIQWTDIQDCLSSGKADDLLSANGKKTDLVQPEVIPTIVIDGNYSRETQDEAFSHFKTVVCTLLGFPDQCKC